jgi:hypothetical protein
MANMKLIEAKTVGAGGVAYIEFTSIPQTYTDLKVLMSVRGTANIGTASLAVQYNGNATGYTTRRIDADGSGVGDASGASSGIAIIQGNTATSNTFSNYEFYLPNYTSSANKCISLDGVNETDGYEYSFIYSNVWSNSAAINTIRFTPTSGSIMQHSTFYLYGISNTIASGAKATGGYVTEDTSYFYHTFLSSGTFTPTQSISADILVVAGGGGAGGTIGGGGGAGGLLAFTSQSLSATGYAITVGAGGAGTPASTNAKGSNGGSSQFGALTSCDGGGGGGDYDSAGIAPGANGGSGGGAAGYDGGPWSGGTATSGQGNNGGTGNGSTGGYGAGGGGGKGAVGGNASVSGAGNTGTAGNGGIGVNTYSSWALATYTGDQGYYAGGGGGGVFVGIPSGAGTGGLGGGGNGSNSGNGINAITNTGGGGGGGTYDYSYKGGNGGSGIVIVRYAK